MTHGEVVMLLPWYANATLSPVDRIDVEAHLHDCADCRAELSLVQKMMQAVVAENAERPTPPADLFLRALGALDADAAHLPAWPWRHRFAQWLRGVAAAVWPSRPAWGLVLVTAQAVAVLALATTFVIREGQRGYATLGGPVQGRGAGAGRAVLDVAFQPDATDGTIRELLGRVGGTIVGGPTAAGLYAVQPRPGANVEQTLAMLRNEARVVRYAERRQ